MQGACGVLGVLTAGAAYNKCSTGTSGTYASLKSWVNQYGLNKSYGTDIDYFSIINDGLYNAGATYASCKAGSFAGGLSKGKGLLGSTLSGVLSGGASDMAYQGLLNDGDIDYNQTLYNATIGGVSGLFGGMFSCLAVKPEEESDTDSKLALLTGEVKVDAAKCSTKQVKPLTPNQMNQAIKTGKAPNGIVRIDQQTLNSSGAAQEKLHATFKDKIALNVDGTWKHDPPKGFKITNQQKNWLTANGWTIPAGY